VEDQIEGYPVLSEETLRFFEKESTRLYEETDYLIVSGGVPGTKLGGAAFVPGPFLKNPKGIRDLEEWYISLLTRGEFIKEVFAKLTEIGLENLKLLHQAAGERIQVILMTATDFGMQRGLLISPEIYRNLFKPYHKTVNAWIHRNTQWKTFIHSCGSVYDLLSDFKEAEFDILNPVQISAARMDPARLKREYGDHFTFWGGGVDTQRTLPFGTPDEVRAEVREMIEIFRPGGGFVFNAVHNIQPGVPVENMLALFETVKEYR
jgi:uroporphyrinogen-III decarboxylase